MIRLSASQVTTFRSCPRKWGWEKIAGLRDPDTLATSFGSRVHEILEAYLNDGTPPVPGETFTFNPDWDRTALTPQQQTNLRKAEGKVLWPGKTALTMMGPHLPEPGTGTVEGKFEWEDPDIEGTFWVGFKDWAQHTYKERITILDHKTSVDPVKYGKTPEELRNDTQFLIYAAHEAQSAAADATIKGIWNYGSRDANPRKAKVVTVEDRAWKIVSDYKKDIVPVARLMRDYKHSIKDPLELPPEPSACDMYGGCPHRSRCKLTDKQRIGAFMMSDSGSLIDSLLAQAGASEPSSTPDTAPVSSTPDPLLALLGDAPPNVPDTAAPAPKASASDPLGALLATQTPDAPPPTSKMPPPAKGDQVNPPEACAPVPTPSVNEQRSTTDADHIAQKVADILFARLIPALELLAKS